MKLSLLLVIAAVTPLLAQGPAVPLREIAGHRTVLGAQVSARPNSIPARYIYEAGRDWLRQPYRLAVLLVEFNGTQHVSAHTAALYDELLFSCDKYHKTPGGEVSFGSVADWYRAQSQGRFELTGKVFDWVTVAETFEVVHSLKLKAAQERYLKVALANVRARDGAHALDDFDGYVFIHVAPITGPSGNIFWSHRASVEGKRYITSGEIERIGVFCHEFGHTLGLPDFYAK
jgi:M6 family metalloprotease-like protein